MSSLFDLSAYPAAPKPKRQRKPRPKPPDPIGGFHPSWLDNGATPEEFRREIEIQRHKWRKDMLWRGFDSYLINCYLGDGRGLIMQDAYHSLTAKIKARQACPVAE